MVEAARRSEASRLLALGQLRLAEDPTEALAFATASLELADTPEARVFAMKALGEGPPARELAGSSYRRASAGLQPRRPASSRPPATTSEAKVWQEDGRGRR